AGSCDAPRSSDADNAAILVDDSVATFDLRAIHEPELNVIGGAVVPENGRFATDAAGSLEGQRSSYADDVATLVEDSVTTIDLRLIHEPELNVIGRAGVPEDRRFASEAADSCDLPRSSDADDVATLVDDSVATLDLRTVHEPELNVVGGAVVPDNGIFP